MISGQVINFDLLLRRREYICFMSRIYANFLRIPRMEKDSNTDRCYSFTNPQRKLQNPSRLSKIPSSDLIWLKTFRTDVHNLPMDIETVASPFYLPIITRNFMIDFYRFQISVDWLVSTFKDNDHFQLSKVSTYNILHSSRLR